MTIALFVFMLASGGWAQLGPPLDSRAECRTIQRVMAHDYPGYEFRCRVPQR